MGQGLAVSCPAECREDAVGKLRRQCHCAHDEAMVVEDGSISKEVETDLEVLMVIAQQPVLPGKTPARTDASPSTERAAKSDAALPHMSPRDNISAEVAAADGPGPGNADNPTQERRRSVGSRQSRHSGFMLSSASVDRNDRNSRNSRNSGMDSIWRQNSSTGVAYGKVLAVAQTQGVHALSNSMTIDLPTGKLDALKGILSDAGIDLTRWGKDGAKSVEQFCWELYTQRGSMLTGLPVAGCMRQLKRVVRLVKVKIEAEIFGVDHVLANRMQYVHNGQVVEKSQVPSRKVLWLRAPGSEESPCLDEACSSELCPYTEDWRVAVQTVLEERIGLSPNWQRQHLTLVEEAYNYIVQDHIQSEGYPGLSSLYCVHEVTMRMKDPEHPGAKDIGLPEGDEFATNSAEAVFGFSEDGLPIGAQLNLWKWVESHTKRVTKMVTQPSTVQANRLKETRASLSKLRLEEGPGADMMKSDEHDGLQVRHPQWNTEGISAMEECLGMTALMDNTPNVTLSATLGAEQTDWDKVNQIATRILDKNYTLMQYFKDLCAFPELKVFLLEEAVRESCEMDHLASTRSENLASSRSLPHMSHMMSEGSFATSRGSGFTRSGSFNRTGSFGNTTKKPGEEYQRAIGAFFAIYWLLRLEGDGKNGFCYGIDKDWHPVNRGISSRLWRRASGPRIMKQLRRGSTGAEQPESEQEKRDNFFDGDTWDHFQKLLQNANLISVEDGHTKVNKTRLVSLLALTAIHGVTKMAVMQPEVQPQDAPYQGYEAGVVIEDQKVGLTYLLEHYPHLVPSFAALPPEEQRVVRFAQCGLRFNHSWLVEAQAPPGAVFAQIRAELICDFKQEIMIPDMALYFVHWLTTFAGAEPTPLAGCEKCVTKMSPSYLSSLMGSFEIVEKITDRTETEVMEEYLLSRWRWHALQTDDDPPEMKGDSAIAKMRLVCQAHLFSTEEILTAFNQVPEEDKEVLSVEMARTGTLCQSYSHHLIPKEVHTSPAGPAFMIYYAGQFLQNQKKHRDPMYMRLRVLAEVYRCARELWPRKLAQAGLNVSIRIDMIKGLSIQQLREARANGEEFVMMKHSECEAFVERASRRRHNMYVAAGFTIATLDFSGLQEGAALLWSTSPTKSPWSAIS